MRNIVLICASTLLLSTLVHAEEKQPLKTDKDKLSYAIGFDQVKNYKRQGMDVDLEKVIMGMQATAPGGKLLLSEGEMSKILADYGRDLRLKQDKVKREAAAKNKIAGEAFQKENKKKEGVITTSSGLQYKILKAGKGPKPTEDDSITVRYRGTLIDGTMFDSTDRIGYPLTITIKDSIISGWKEAVMLMSAGSNWQVVVPPELAYGENGIGRDIGPNATLIYDIELIAVNPLAVSDKKKDAAK